MSRAQVAGNDAQLISTPARLLRGIAPSPLPLSALLALALLEKAQISDLDRKRCAFFPRVARAAAQYGMFRERAV